MSQIFKDLTAGPVPPTVPTSFTTDVRDNTTTGPGTAIPAANVLQLLGRDTTQNNDNGIRTDADPNNGNIVYTELTNRLQGTATTVGATTQTAITFDLGASAAAYMFEFMVAGRATAGGTAATGYWFMGTARTDGVTATAVGSNEDFAEDATLASSDVNLVAAGNSATLEVVGVAGFTINWNVVGYYVRAI